MKKWRVYVAVNTVLVREVEAENVEDAKEAGLAEAWEMILSNELPSRSVYVDIVDEIEDWS